MTREYGFKFAPLQERFGAVTLTLPYAGATRIRFEGLPDDMSGSQSAYDRHPQQLRILNKAAKASQIPDTPVAINVHGTRALYRSKINARSLHWHSLRPWSWELRHRSGIA